MKPYSRAERISTKIQTAITDLLSKKMQDPRVEMATISDVKLTPDLRVANVYVAVYGDKKRSRDALEGFKRSKGYIKKMIAPTLGLKYMPELRFQLDETFDKAAHMDELFKSVATDEDPESTPSTPTDS